MTDLLLPVMCRSGIYICRPHLVEAASAGLAGVGARRHGAGDGRVQTVLAGVGQGEAAAVQRDAHGYLLLGHAALDVVVDGEVLWEHGRWGCGMMASRFDV